MLGHRQPADDHRAAATIAQAKAELDVGNSVEPELGVESSHRLGVGATKGHAVTLDRVDLRPIVFGELLEGVLAAQPIGPCHHHGRIVEHAQERRDRVARQLDARIEEHDHLAGSRFDAGVDGGGEPQRRIEGHHSQPLRLACLQPAGHPHVTRVVDQNRLEIGLAVSEHREQPPLDVGPPAMHNGEQRDRARDRCSLRWCWGFERLQLAALGAV